MVRKYLIFPLLKYFDETKKNIGIAKKGEGESEMQEPEKNDPGEIGHGRMSRDGPQSLFGAPNAEE